MSTVTPPKPLDALIERLRDASSRPGRNTLDVGHYWNLCDEAADALVHLAAQATGAAQDTKPLEAQVFKFLLGEEELDGMWFGKRKVGEPAYWWRHDLRAALAARDSVIANLEAKFAQAMAALERVADPMTSWRDCGLIARQALAARGAWDERSGE